MAKAKKNQEKAVKKRARGKRGGKYYFWLLGTVSMAVVFLPTTVLLAFGLIPTLVAILIDKTKERTAGMTVGMMNFAGCMPFLMELWNTEGTLQDAYDILLDPTAFMIMYGGAAVGWIIYFNVPPIVSMYMVRRYESRVRAIDRRMEMLEEIWGEEVKGKVLQEEEDEELQEAMETPDFAEQEKPPESAAQPAG